MTNYNRMFTALEKARDRAKNPDWKLLWQNKIDQLHRKLVPDQTEGDIFNGWPEDGEPVNPHRKSS